MKAGRISNRERKTAMAKNKQSKAAKYRRRRLLVVLAALLLVAYFAYAIISSSVEIHKERQQLERLQVQLEQQQRLNDELERIINSGDVQKQMERVAREKLGYALPGEKIYVDSIG